MVAAQGRPNARLFHGAVCAPPREVRTARMLAALPAKFFRRRTCFPALPYHSYFRASSQGILLAKVCPPARGRLSWPVRSSSIKCSTHSWPCSRRPTVQTITRLTFGAVRLAVRFARVTAHSHSLLKSRLRRAWRSPYTLFSPTSMLAHFACVSRAFVCFVFFCVRLAASLGTVGRRWRRSAAAAGQWRGTWTRWARASR